MPGVLTLTAPIPVRNVRTIRLQQIDNLDDENGSMVVRFTCEGPGQIQYPQAGRLWSLTITNGRAQGIRAKASPDGFLDVIEEFNTVAPAVATAFDDCWAALKASGRNGLVAAMQTLGLLPAGAVA